MSVIKVWKDTWPMKSELLFCSTDLSLTQLSGKHILFWHLCFGESWEGRSVVDRWSFRLPRGHAPQCHSCPYSVAEQGEPGGGADCRTVKRGRGACWHLPLLTAAGRGKICFSICLFRALSSPQSPPCISFTATLPDGTLNIVYLDQLAQMRCNFIGIPTSHCLFSWSVPKNGTN